MGRFELKRDVVERLGDVTRLCEEAITCNADAVIVPPVFVASAFEMLKSTKIEIVCLAAGADDSLETKITAIESNRLAQGVIVSIPRGHILDGLWDLISKELTQLNQIAQTHDKSIWAYCRFGNLSRVQQAQICASIPRGMGLRVEDSSLSDVKFAKLIAPCMPFCLCRVHSDGCYEEADCFEVFKMPPQKKTDQLFMNGEKI